MNKTNNLEKQLEKKLVPTKSISLSDEEKDRMRSFLTSYQGFNPVKTNSPKEIASSQLSAWMRLALPAFALAFFFVSGGAVMAERSLPGDSLYSLKTSFENVRGHLALSSESKVRWNTIRVERRLSEARSLASSGKLSQEVATDLAQNVDSYSSSIEGGLDELRSRNRGVVALEIDGEYRSTVRMYKNLLKRLSEENTELIALLEGIEARGDGLAMASEQEEAVALAKISPLDADTSLVAFSLSDLESESDTTTSTPLAPDLPEEGEAVDSLVATSTEGEVAEARALSMVSIDGEALKTETIIRDSSDLSNLTDSEIFSLPIETLEVFVMARIGKSEVAVKSARLSNDLRAELKERINQASNVYDQGRKAREAGDDESARSYYKKALRSAEDVRAAVRVSGSVLHDEILQSLDELSAVRKDINKTIESKVKSGLDKTLKDLGL